MAESGGESPDLAETSGIFPVVGKAMLGIAGAYLLRAAAESGSFPKMGVVALALAYAAMWLILAARVRAGETFASTAYAVTSALILAPMLAELTLVFRVLAPSATAFVLAVFVAAAFTLTWRRDLPSVVWVATVTAVVTALALLISSRDLVPFTAALLFLCVVSEFAAFHNRLFRLRPVAAMGADLATVVLIYIYSQTASARSEYPDVAPGALVTLPSLLFLIYGTSIALRTVLHQQRITIFEIGQAVIAFLLAAFSVYSFTPNVRALGIACLLLSALCYAATFVRFDRLSEQRNYYVYATWSMALVLPGSFLSLPSTALAPCLSLASLAATFLGLRTVHRALEFHGVVYLAAAALTSGLLDYAARALAGTFPDLPGRMMWLVSACAVLVYAIGGNDRGDRWYQRLLQLLAAAIAVSAVATFLVSVLVWLAESGMSPTIHHVAVIRTLITCGLALALAFSGSRWQRIELVWIAYGALALVSAKLLLQDLPRGHSGSIAISISLYAVALILVPRAARMGQRVG